MEAKIARLSDINNILQLQEENLFARLSDEELKNGFVTTPFTIAQLEEIIAGEGAFIVKDEEQLIAYCFAGTWEYFEQWPIFPFMTSRFPLLLYQEQAITIQNSFQYGPVCIDKNYRGKKVLHLIFEEMRTQWKKKFPMSITFINQVNSRSVKAHEKIGWEVIDKFEFNQNQYFGLAFNMNNPVI